MGLSQYPHLEPFDLEGVIQENEKKCNSNGSLWNKVLEARAKRRCRLGTNQRMRSRTSRRILMKRTARVTGSRRPAKGIERRVKTLKNLVPNSDSAGLDDLFRETADYILSLQMRVRVMQIMVKVLTDSEE